MDNHEDDAWKFLSFLSGEEGEKIMVRTGLLSPARKSVAESLHFPFVNPAFSHQYFY